MEAESTEVTGAGRVRLPREQRHRQLLDVAWQVVREQGTEALSLGRLAERAGVTKPVVYDHFGTRAGLLAALYREYDDRQIARMVDALQAAEATLAARARLVAGAYVDCVLAQGQEITGVVAALHGSPELEAVRAAGETAFMHRCREALAPFVPGELPAAGLRAVLGAADALSYAAATGEITADAARRELEEVVLGLAQRAGAVRPGEAAPST